MEGMTSTLYNWERWQNFFLIVFAMNQIKYFLDSQSRQLSLICGEEMRQS